MSSGFVHRPGNYFRNFNSVSMRDKHTGSDHQQNIKLNVPSLSRPFCPYSKLTCKILNLFFQQDFQNKILLSVWVKFFFCKVALIYNFLKCPQSAKLLLRPEAQPAFLFLRASRLQNHFTWNKNLNANIMNLPAKLKLVICTLLRQLLLFFQSFFSFRLSIFFFCFKHLSFFNRKLD